MKLGLIGLTNALNLYAGELNKSEFELFFNFIWERWRDESDWSNLDLSREWALYKEGVKC